MDQSMVRNRNRFDAWLVILWILTAVTWLLTFLAAFAVRWIEALPKDAISDDSGRDGWSCFAGRFVPSPARLRHHVRVQCCSQTVIAVGYGTDVQLYNHGVYCRATK